MEEQTPLKTFEDKLKCNKPSRIQYISSKMMQTALKGDTASLNDSYNSITIIFATVVIPNEVRFWIYTVLLVPSFISYLLLLYWFLSDENLRRALHNHVITVILLCNVIFELFVFPAFIYSYKYDTAMFRSPMFCIFWAYIDYAFYYMQVILVAWGSMERHILIFHDRWAATRKMRFFVHYLPLIMIVLYCVFIYLPAFFFPGCEVVIDYTVAPCYNYCYFGNRAALLYDNIVSNNLPTLAIIVFNIALIVRVFLQKRRMNQPIQCRKHRKIAIQIFSISGLFLFCTFPYTFGTLLSVCGVSSLALSNMLVLTAFGATLDVLLYPFICVCSLSEIRLKMKKLFTCSLVQPVPSVT